MSSKRYVGPNEALILASAFFYISSVMVVNPLVTGFTTSLGATAAEAGTIAGAMSLCSLACRPVGGNLSDRLSKKRLALVGALLMVLSAFGYAFATSPVQVAALRLVNGAGYSFCSVCVSTWFANMLPSEHIGSGMGIFGLMNALALAVAPSLGIALNDTFGYRPVMLAAAAFAVCSVICMLLARAAKTDVPKAPARDPQAPTVRPRLRLVCREALPVAVNIALFTVPYCAVQSFLVQYVSARELALNTGIYFAAYSAALVVLRLALRDAFDTKPYGLFVVVSALCEVVALVLLACAQTSLALAVAGVLMAGGYGVMCSISQAASVRIAGPQNTGLGNSTYFVGFDVGMMLGPVLGGIAFGALELGWVFPVFVVAPLLSIGVYALAHRRGL